MPAQTPLVGSHADPIPPICEEQATGEKDETGPVCECLVDGSDGIESYRWQTVGAERPAGDHHVYGERGLPAGSDLVAELAVCDNIVLLHRSCSTPKDM